MKFLMNKGFKIEPRQDCHLLTSPTGKQSLANLRWKTKPVWGKRAKRWEWSIPKKSWDRYIKTKVKMLFVLEKSTRIVYAAKVSDLTNEVRIYENDDLDKGGTVFLPVEKYKRLGVID